MIKKIVFGVSLGTLVVLTAAPSAFANCIPAKSAATFGASGTAYWLPAGAASTVSAQAWQLGAPGTFQMSAACVAGQTGIFEDVGGGLSLNLNLGDACAAGCPSGPIAVAAYNTAGDGTSFLLSSVVETPAAAVNFDFGSQGDHSMIPIPRPRVTSSSRSGTDVLLSITVDSIAAGIFGPNAGNAVTGYRILGKSASSDPGGAAGSYDASPRAILPAAGGIAAVTPLTVNCSDLANDQFLVVQLSFENGSVLSGATSAATRIRCNPALANPKTPKVKIAPKKGVATN